LKDYLSIYADDTASPGTGTARLAAALSGRVIGFAGSFAAGAEIDLVLERTDGRRLAFEIKLGSAPSPSRGFWSGLDDLKPSAAFVVYPGTQRYPLGQGVEALPVSMLASVLGR